MILCVHLGTLGDQASIQHRLIAAAQAGFRGVELPVAAQPGALSDAGQARNLARAADGLGLSIAVLSADDRIGRDLIVDDPLQRRRGIELALCRLDLAARLRAGVLRIAPVLVGDEHDAPAHVAYSDALSRTYEALDGLGHAAAERGVTIAIDVARGRFLLSPCEAADLLDRVNSPHVGAYIDLAAVGWIGFVQDWINTLARHVTAVHAAEPPGGAPECGDAAARAGKPAGQASRRAAARQEPRHPVGTAECSDAAARRQCVGVDWPAVIAALHTVRFRGPFVCDARDDPAATCRRFTALLQTPAAAGPDAA